MLDTCGRAVGQNDPLLVAVKDMLPEEWQTFTVNFDGTPGIGIYQRGKVFFSLLQGQLIGTTIKKFSDSTYSPRVGIDGLLGHSLKFE